jgi:hypothetical protein
MSTPSLMRIHTFAQNLLDGTYLIQKQAEISSKCKTCGSEGIPN